MREKLFQWKLKRLERRGEHYRREYEVRKSYEQYVPERKKRKVSNILLVVVVAAITIYTVINLWITYSTGVSIDSTLTTCYYAFWTSEVCLLAGIRISKVKNNYYNTSYAESSFIVDEIEESEDEYECG